MNLFLLAPSPNVSGPIPKHTPYLINSLRCQGVIVDIGVWGQHSSNEWLMRKITDRFHDILITLKKLKTKQYDVLLIKTGHDWLTLSRDIILLLLVHKYSIAKVIQFHGSDSNKLIMPGNLLFKFFSKLLIYLCDSALFLSTEELLEWQRFVPAKKFYIVRNPVIPVSEEPWNGGTKDQNEEPILLFVGRLIEPKGILDVIEAMPMILNVASCRLIICGVGDAYKKAEKMIADYKLCGSVSLYGYIDGKDLSTIYNSANIFIFPTYWAEGFPTVIAEAMKFGLPIITTHIRGAADHLKEGDNAIFVQPKDPKGLANAAIYLIKNPELCRKMGKNNTIKVKIFSPENVGFQYLNVLTEILQSKHSNRN